MNLREISRILQHVNKLSGACATSTYLPKNSVIFIDIVTLSDYMQWNSKL